MLAAGLLATAGASLADILVVRSVGPSAGSFPPGKRLPETDRISLKLGDRLVVLDGRGTRIVRGPGTFTAGIPQAARMSSGPASQRRFRIGAVRGPGIEARPPSIWHVDVAKSSNVCVADPRKITLWRANPAKTVTLDVIRVDDGATRQVSWKSGASTLDWPSDLPIASGGRGRITFGGGTTPINFTFHILPQQPGGLEDMAQTLIRNRCEVQLDHFIETVKLPD